MATFISMAPPPPPGAPAPQIIVVVQQGDANKRFERLHFVKCPLCCITKGSHESFLTPDDLLVKRHETYCKLPVSFGAGYDVDLVQWNKIGQWHLKRERFLCLAPKHNVSVYPAPSWHNINFDIGAQDDKDFMDSVRRYTGISRGKTSAISNSAPKKEFVWKPCCACGCESKTLTVAGDGLFTWDHSVTSCSSTQLIDAGWLDEVGYIHTTTAGPCGSLCCGNKNTVQIAAPKDHQALVGSMGKALIPEVHKELLQSMLGRAPSAAIQRWQGGNGYAEVGPEFTTVNVHCNPTLNSVTLGLCDRSEVTSFRTKDVAYLKAGLPSWQNAFIRMVREVELFRLSKTIGDLFGTDIVLLPVWPCSFFSDAKLALTLAIVAMLRISAFLYLFFCRKTSVLFGGPGHAKQVTFPVDAEPEKRLREIAAAVKAANAAFHWERHVNTGAGVTGAAKGMPIAMGDGQSVVQVNPLAFKSAV